MLRYRPVPSGRSPGPQTRAKVPRPKRTHAIRSTSSTSNLSYPSQLVVHPSSPFSLDSGGNAFFLPALKTSCMRTNPRNAGERHNGRPLCNAERLVTGPRLTSSVEKDQPQGAARMSDRKTATSRIIIRISLRSCGLRSNFMPFKLACPSLPTMWSCTEIPRGAPPRRSPGSSRCRRARVSGRLRMIVHQDHPGAGPAADAGCPLRVKSDVPQMAPFVGRCPLCLQRRPNCCAAAIRR